ncbi:MAG TPA: hypothetical protein VJZ75_02080 [Candidatus Bathyarchaeia archaeon]|nr:hypothetical protein [Candidatus Bathyarchaeia archaeon]
MESKGICDMQYQQNFFPASASTGAGSGRQNPTKNIITPTTRIGRPKPEAPRGIYRSIEVRNAPKMKSMMPETTRPLYMQINHV